MSGHGERGGHLLLGILQLALLRAEGMRQFAGTRQAFLNSFAPLLAFPLVGAVLDVVSGAGAEDLATLLGGLVALLAPPVLSEAMARLFGREQEWLRYATAFNWTRWVMLLALGASLILMGTLAAAGLSERAAVTLGVAAVLIYSMVLDWFVARVGLRLTAARAVALVVVVNFGAGLLSLGPHLLTVLQDMPTP